MLLIKGAVFRSSLSCLSRTGYLVKGPLCNDKEKIFGNSAAQHCKKLRIMSSVIVAINRTLKLISLALPLCLVFFGSTSCKSPAAAPITEAKSAGSIINKKEGTIDLQPLIRAKSLRCIFPDMGNDPINFDAISVPEGKSYGTARIISMFADSINVVSHPSGGFTFLEFPPAGYVNFTTVFPVLKNEPDAQLIAPEFWAVHSRHSGFANTILPQQYIGTCTISE